MDNVTFDNMPAAISKILIEVSDMKKKLDSFSPSRAEAVSEDFFNVQEAAEFLHLKIPTVYSKVSKGELPVMKRSKRLYFSKTELVEYLKNGRRLTPGELREEVNTIIKRTKLNRNG